MKATVASLGGCLAVVVAIAGPLFAAHDEGIVEPLEVRKSYAAAGDPTAQFNLGLMHLKGEGVAKDPTLAVPWLIKSAQAGFAPAQWMLGVIYSEGDGVPRDEKEAVKWLTLAGQQGMFEAQKRLITFHAEGRGIPKNPAAALTWDFYARRTLELRYGQPAGEPPHPPVLRKDGTAEVVMKDGTKKILHPGGGEEAVRADGAKVITFRDGKRKTIEQDGTETMESPGGFAEIHYPDGRKTLRDPKGTMETTYPDGRKELQGPGTDQRGRAVVITEALDQDGKRTGRTIVRGKVTIRENETGPFSVETLLKDQSGVEVKLTEEVRPDGRYGRKKLARADTGEEPKGFEVWTIRRVIELKDGTGLFVEETYSLIGFGEQRVIGTTVPPVTGISEKNSPIRMPAAMPAMPVEMTSVGGTTTFRSIPSDKDLLQEKENLGPMLSQLENIENNAQHFAGATEANWNSAKAAAASYVIPLANVPQQKGITSAWFIARQMSGSKMLDVPFLPATHDFSQQFPLGLHGREVIGRYRWLHAQTPHFIVHYVSEPDARLSMHYIEFAYTAVLSLLGLDPQRGAQKGHVFLFSGASDWRQYLSASQKDPRLGGFAYKNELLMPVVTGGKSDAADNSSRTLCHEVTHAIVARFYPTAKPPLWLNEGFAEYVAALTLSARSGTPVDKYMSAKADHPIKVDDVFRRIRYGGDSVFAFYANSAWCVRTLCEKLPADGFPKFFNAVSAGNQPEVAFRASYGVKCPDARAFTTLANAWDMTKAGAAK